MALTALQKQQRENRLTASQVGCLMRGDEAAIYQLWLEQIGSPDWQEPDFSNNWPVQLGAHTESLHLDWLNKRGHVIGRRGEVVIHPEYDWRACTLDGWCDVRRVPVECKHIIQYKKFEDARDWYLPQLHWIMHVTGTTQIVFSAIVGALEPQQDIVEWSDPYGAELISRAEAFWQCVIDLVPPVALAEIKAPVPIEKWRTVDMSSSNTWASNAADWLENKDAAKTYEKAQKELKALVEPDVGLAIGHGVQIKRSVDGKLLIKEKKGE